MKMNGYSEMRLSSNKMDFSDLLYSPPTQENKEKTSPQTPNHSACEAPKAEAVAKNTSRHHDSLSKVKEEDYEEDASRGSDVGGAVKLTRTCSVAPSSSHRFRLERQSSRRTTGIQSAVKRVFSMRRSSSVSERYCRIYDQHVALEPAFHDDDGNDDAEGTNNNAMKARSMKNKKNNGILKACRRLLKF